VLRRNETRPAATGEESTEPTQRWSRATRAPTTATTEVVVPTSWNVTSSGEVPYTRASAWASRRYRARRSGRSGSEPGAYLESERPRTSVTERVFVVLKGGDQGRP
jgi:hypothetical protein